MIQPLPETSIEDFANLVKRARNQALSKLSRSHRSANGQFFTPYPIARFMASLQTYSRYVRILDPGSGVGALTLATVASAVESAEPPIEIEAVCVESEDEFHPALRQNLETCQRYCAENGVRFSFRLIEDDFIFRASSELASILPFSDNNFLGRFTHVILNPPYKKLNSSSQHRLSLREIGIETSNLYAAFVWLALLLLENNGQITAITPRSFCNGLYFRPFRQALRNAVGFNHIHSIKNRQTAFAEDEVLQENIIFHARKNQKGNTNITLSVGNGAHLEQERIVPAATVVDSDRDAVIHLILNQNDAEAKARIESFPCSLETLGIEVSTGPVVDFRSETHLRFTPGEGAVPLLYPCHFNGGTVEWPKLHNKKPNAICATAETENLLLPVGYYVLVKRFTSKEEKKRVVAVVLSPEDLPMDIGFVGIENHINYFHQDRSSLDPNLAKGLCCFLNSTVVDTYLRVFNGHTQVNATDLRKLRYPSKASLKSIGRAYAMNMAQEKIDEIVNRLIEKIPLQT